MPGGWATCSGEHHGTCPGRDVAGCPPPCTAPFRNLLSLRVHSKCKRRLIYKLKRCASLRVPSRALSWWENTFSFLLARPGS